jgi:hypothetical protein
METRAENPPNGRAASGDGSKKLGRQMEKVGHTAEQMWDRTRDSFSDFSDAVDLKGRVNRNPYGTVAAALGIGYVLGGGLFTPLTARIVGMGLRIGMRLAVLPLLKQEVAEVLESIEDDDGRVRGEAAGKGQASKRTRTRGEEP